jgi:hypothetical protein
MDHFGPLRCPVCDYDLRGLPVPHRCPECGAQYDICRTRWHPTLSSVDPGWIFRRFAMFCVVIIGTSIFLPGGSLVLGILTAIGLILVVAWIAYRIQHEYVQFESSGVIVRSVERESKIPWRRISHVQRHAAKWKLQLVQPNSAVTLPPILSGKDSEREFHQSFAAARNRWLRQDSNRLEPDSTKTRRELIGPLTQFEKCPLCERDVCGLPAEYTCPSCGFAFDPATRVWKPPHRWSQFLVALIALGCVSIPTVMFIRFLTGEYIPRKFASLPALLLAATLALAVGLSVRVSRSRYVAIKSDGVYARTAFGPRFIPWTEIASAQRRGKTVIVLSHRNRELLRLSGVFAHETAAEQFRRAVTAQPEPANAPHL